MTAYQFISESTEKTLSFGEAIARNLKKGDIVCLFGDLGAGKTTLIKGIAKGFQIPLKKVLSPTFVLMNIYNGKKSTLKLRTPIYHFDLYRLENMGDINLIGYEEFFYGDGIALIEWADRLKKLMPSSYLSVEIKHKDEASRKIICKAHGARYNEYLKKISIFKK